MSDLARAASWCSCVPARPANFPQRVLVVPRASVRCHKDSILVREAAISFQRKRWGVLVLGWKQILRENERTGENILVHERTEKRNPRHYERKETG
jgi:Mlc titration factor MtfA (ptsG expression regulator)